MSAYAVSCRWWNPGDDAYLRWRIPDIELSDKIEIFTPTLVRSQRQSNWNSPPQVVTAYNSRYWQFMILTMCLYADRLWLPDPLELLASVWEDGVPTGIGNGQQYFSPYFRAILRRASRFHRR